MTTLREAAQQALEALETGGWNMTTRAIADLERALAQQAELSEGLGPLPPTTYVLARESDGYSPERLLSEAGYTEEHMRAYAAAAVALERDSRQALPVGEMRLSEIIDGMVVPVVTADLPVGTKLYTAPPQCKQAEPLNLSDPAVQKRLATQWGYVPAAAQAEPVEPVAWEASEDGRTIQDNDFTHDVVLRVVGDFEDNEQRSRYAQRIVDKLNAALAQQAEPAGQLAELQAMLRAEVDRLIAAGIQPQRTMVPLTEEEIKTAFHAARNAKLGASQDNSRHRLSVIEIARAVEKASWEKNHG